VDPERFAGRDAMPDRGWDAVTVPGAVSTWVALSQRFGALPFAQLFEPALRYAGSPPAGTGSRSTIRRRACCSAARTWSTGSTTGTWPPRTTAGTARPSASEVVGACGLTVDLW